MRNAHATPPAGGQTRRWLLPDVIDEHVVEAVGTGAGFDRIPIEAILEGRRQPPCENRRTGDAMAECNGIALGIEAGAKRVVVIWSVDIVPDVFLARPDHLDRVIDLFGDLDRLSDAIHIKATTEAPAEQMIMHSDLLERKSRDRSRGRLGAGNHLSTYPHVATILADMDGAVHRLHGGMRQQRHLVDGVNPARRSGHCLAGIALIDGY